MTIRKEILHLVSFISLLKQLRSKKNANEAGFYLVNDLNKIVSFRQCLYWRYENGRIQMMHATGQTEVSDDSPYIRNIKSYIQALIKRQGMDDKVKYAKIYEKNGASKSVLIQAADLAKLTKSKTKEDLYDYRAAENILCSFCLAEDGILGGLWFDKSKKFHDMEVALIEDAVDALSDKMSYEQKSAPLSRRFIRRFKRLSTFIFIGFVLLCFLPVRMTVTAPMEVVSRDNTVVTAPIQGVVEQIYVRPNETVEKGQILISLDRTELKNNLDIARQKMITAEANLAKTQRELLSDPTKATEVGALKEQIKLRKLELEYYRERLKFSEIRAPSDGVVLFSDANDVLGKPVEVGSQIMNVANPNSIEALIRIPAQSIIDFEDAAEVKFFLNVNPLDSHAGTLVSLSYQSSKDDDGLLTYKARAAIADPDEIERVGLVGTAKIYGDETILFFNIFRRPFVALRNIFLGGV